MHATRRAVCMSQRLSNGLNDKNGSVKNTKKPSFTQRDQLQQPAATTTPRLTSTIATTNGPPRQRIRLHRTARETPTNRERRGDSGRLRERRGRRRRGEEEEWRSGENHVPQKSEKTQRHRENALYMFEHGKNPYVFQCNQWLTANCFPLFVYNFWTIDVQFGSKSVFFGAT